MASRKPTSKRRKSINKSIQLKNRSRKSRKQVRSYSRYSSANSFLDRDVPVRSIIKYTSITLAFIIVLLAVFMLGRMSADSNSQPATEKYSQLSGETKQMIKEGTSTEELRSTEAEKEEIEEETIEVVNLSDSSSESDDEQETEEEDVDAEEEEEPSCSYKVAGFDHTYTNVKLGVSNLNKGLRGDNWGSIDALKITVTNNEKCTIINPTQVKIKLNQKGKGSIWWDDEVFLPASFNHMLPGTTVSEVIAVHVSYSDIYSEKDLRLTVFDDYDIVMATHKEYLTLHGE